MLRNCARAALAAAVLASRFEGPADWGFDKRGIHEWIYQSEKIMWVQKREIQEPFGYTGWGFEAFHILKVNNIILMIYLVVFCDE